MRPGSHAESRSTASSDFGDEEIYTPQFDDQKDAESDGSNEDSDQILGAVNRSARRNFFRQWDRHSDQTAARDSNDENPPRERQRRRNHNVHRPPPNHDEAEMDDDGNDDNIIMDFAENIELVRENLNQQPAPQITSSTLLSRGQMRLTSSDEESDDADFDENNEEGDEIFNLHADPRIYSYANPAIDTYADPTIDSYTETMKEIEEVYAWIKKDNEDPLSTGPLK